MKLKKMLLGCWALLCTLSPTAAVAQVCDCGMRLPTGEDSVRYARFWEGAARAQRARLAPAQGAAQATATQTAQGIVWPGGEVYQFRVALCLTPEVLGKFYNGEGVLDKQLVRDWWDETERKLQEYYRNDVGIDLQVVRDERLIVTDNTTGYEFRVNGSPNFHFGTEIINNLIGADKYDVGVLIMNATGSLNGTASLGGASSPYRKAAAHAITEPQTIAHEMGHLFGATHTHERSDADYTEPGQGQSIMSYGYPRTFFSVSSIRAMRNLIKALNIYTDPDRTQKDLSRNDDTENTNIVYAYPETGTQPLLQRELMRKEYTVTRGSNFQFYLPLANAASLKDKTVSYCAHGYDIGTELSNNALKPTEKPGTEPCIMFHTRYQAPESLKANEPESSWPVPYSDASRKGLFCFALAAHQASLYDSEKSYVRIVEGEPFRASLTSPTNTALFRWGRPFTVEWTPQTDLYGPDRRVRIRLSTDFGQTFPYILADNLPNSGRWEGCFPFLTIGRTGYRDFQSPVTGGVLKVEIVGEAVYGLTHDYAPYYWNGSEYVVTGGFSLDQTTARYLFKQKDSGAAAPEAYVKVQSEDEIPAEIPELVAYRSTNPSTLLATTRKEVREGRLVRRTWTANASGTEYVYTQLFELPETAAETAALEKQLREAQAEMAELVRHEGEAGYPLPSLPAFRTLKAGYDKVFDEEGFLRPGFAEADGNALLSALALLQAAEDNEITYPATGRYLLRSYQAMPATTPYFYYTRTADAEAAESWQTAPAEATPIEMTVSEGKVYLKDDLNRVPRLDGMTNTYTELYLQRGYSWGCFTLVNRSNWAFQLSRSGATTSIIYRYGDAPKGYRCNNNDNIITSTDFQFVPIVADRTAPQEMRYYRLRSKATGKWLSLPASLGNGEALRLVGTPAAENIFLLSEGKLLAYASGYFVQNYLHGALDQGTVFTLTPHATETDCYALSTGAGYLHSADLHSVDLTTEATEVSTAWEIVPVQSLPLRISAAGYTTLYCPQNFLSAEGLKVYAAHYAPERTAFVLRAIEGVVPAATGLVVKGAAGTYDLALTELTANAESDLTGQYETTAAREGLFTLQNGEDGIGFYRFGDEVTGSVEGLTLKGFRAYWDAPAGLSVASLQMVFDDSPATGFSLPRATATDENVWFDLSGRQVNKPQRGIYIVNRRKVCR